MLRKPGAAIGSLVLIFILIALLWNTKIVLPLKILVVFFHEISHGLAAVLTGGSIAEIVVGSDQGGLASTAGGSRFLTLNAGYVGSFLWGSALILATAYSRRDKTIAGVLGAILLAVTGLYVRNIFGFAFGLAAGTAFIFAAKRLSHDLNDFLLKTVGLTSCGYAILDIWDDVMTRSCRSDARMLAEMTHLPATVWGALWIALSVAGIYYTLKLAYRADRR